MIEESIELVKNFIRGIIYGIIYIRVSSDEQSKGTSLEFQKEMCLKYFKQKGIVVAAIFVESESAKDLSLNNRKEFLRAMEFCRKHKPWIQAFVVLRVERFARNTEDHFAVRKVLLGYETTLHSVTETIGNKPSEKFIETVLAATAEYDNALRKQRCSDGMSQRINQGIFPWKPPVGYRCLNFKKKDEKKTYPDPPDEAIFPIIQRGLKEYSKNLLKPTELAIMLDEWGLAQVRGRKTDVRLVDKMLGRYLKFYAGLLDNPWTDEKDIKGQHLAMITMEEYQRIILIRTGKSRLIKRATHNENFPLKNSVVLCFTCSITITGSTSRGNGGQYPYYHCKNHKCPMYGKTIKKEILEKEFLGLLETITPKTKFLEVFKASILDIWQEKGKLYENEAKKYGKQLIQLEERRKKIFEMGENGSYKPEEFRERKTEIDNQMATIKISMSENRIDQLDIEATLTFANNFIANLGRQWFEASPALRQRFQRLVFPEGITYNREKGFGTAKLGYIYEQNRIFLSGKSPVVDPAGIEPASPHCK